MRACTATHLDQTNHDCVCCLTACWCKEGRYATLQRKNSNPDHPVSVPKPTTSSYSTPQTGSEISRDTLCSLTLYSKYPSASQPPSLLSWQFGSHGTPPEVSPCASYQHPRSIIDIRLGRHAPLRRRRGDDRLPYYYQESPEGRLLWTRRTRRTTFVEDTIGTFAIADFA